MGTDAPRHSDGDGGASQRRRSELNPEFTSKLATLPDEDAMEAILREKLDMSHRISAIGERFPRRLDIAKVDNKLQNLGFSEESLPKLCDELMTSLVQTLFGFSSATSFVDRFELHAGGKKEHPFVHHGHLNDGNSAVKRLMKPFGDTGRLLNVCPDPLPINTDKTRVIHGETGIGKTHHALFSNPGGLVVYLMYSSDFKFKKPLPSSGDSGFPDVHSEDLTAFNNRVRDDCAEAFRKTSGLVATDAEVVKEMKNVNVRVVVDELGQKPNLTRLFIKQRQEFQKMLDKPFENWPGCKQVDFLLVGTGIDLNVQLGSDTNVYERVLIDAATSEFFINIVRNMGPLKKWAHWGSSLGTALANEPFLSCVEELIQNRRAAVLTATEFACLMDAHTVQNEAEMLRVFLGAADAIVYRVAVKFKGLNAMEYLAPDALRYAALAAFKLSMPRKNRPSPTAYELRLYMARLGLLVDPSGRLMVDTITNSIVGTVDTLTMSPAIRLMLLVLLGFTDLTTESAAGSGLERLVALKCVLAMLAIRDNSDLNNALRTAPMAPKTSRKNPLGCLKVPTPKMKKAASATETVLVRGIALLLLRHRLSRRNKDTSSADATPSRTDEVSDKVYSTLSDIRAHVQKGKAVVVLNGAGAPYADVIAIRPGYVGFFQAKDDDDFDPSEECAKLLEKANANITEALCGIAGVDPANAGLVIVSRCEEGSKGALESGHPWCVLKRGDDFLFPFRWPVSLLRGDHGCRYSGTSYTETTEDVPLELQEGRDSS